MWKISEEMARSALEATEQVQENQRQARDAVSQDVQDSAENYEDLMMPEPIRRTDGVTLCHTRAASSPPSRAKEEECF